MEKSLEIHTISKIDVCRGQSSITSDGLAMLSDLILTGDGPSQKTSTDPKHDYSYYISY